MKDFIKMFLKMVVFAALPLIITTVFAAILIASFIDGAMLQLILGVMSSLIITLAFILYMYWLMEIKNIF